MRNGRLYNHLTEGLEKMKKFSVILPTYNRAFCICKAVDSLLAQTFRDWELVIVDDGSTDGTEALLREKYAEWFASGAFKYLRQSNSGVCRARNRGLAESRGDWIAYLDSDNLVRSDWLQSFADEIRRNPGIRTLYSKFMTIEGREEKGQAFDWDQLLVRNTIDLGVFVHDRRLYEELGGFDESFRRLVDWELILRYTRHHAPAFVDRVLMDYNNSRSYGRITGDWNGNQDWKAAVIAKHGAHLPLVTTAIITFNHKPYIAAALESAIRQNGAFRREIIVSDDGSTDGTAEIVADYARRYPHLIRDISAKANGGVSANIQKCLAAAKGDYIASLEGDDYWMTDDKLARQLKFLIEHPACPMVFSRTAVQSDANPALRRLKSQEGLPELMTGRDFFNTGSSSVIVNFSCCLFRRESLQDLPEELWVPRLSEIALSFHLERRGPIGFIPNVLSVYRIHEGSVWQGADFSARKRQQIDCRKAALKVCAPEYVADFTQEIERIEATCKRTKDPCKMMRAHLRLGKGGCGKSWAMGVFRAFMPYGLVVWWRRYYFGIEMDWPLFYFPGWGKRLRRIVKFALPYGLSKMFQRRSPGCLKSF